MKNTRSRLDGTDPPRSMPQQVTASSPAATAAKSTFTATASPKTASTELEAGGGGAPHGVPRGMTGPQAQLRAAGWANITSACKPSWSLQRFGGHIGRIASRPTLTTRGLRN